MITCQETSLLISKNTIYEDIIINKDENDIMDNTIHNDITSLCWFSLYFSKFGIPAHIIRCLSLKRDEIRSFVSE